MSKSNPLAGLIGNYGDSDDESDDGTSNSLSTGPISSRSTAQGYTLSQMSSAAIHPAPIAHCPWSACYDDTSGFTYYWNQQTNAVTWEAPPEYLLALKLAQQQLQTAGSPEVSAEEWQLYQQALAEKKNSQHKMIPKTPPKAIKKNEKNAHSRDKNNKNINRKRSNSDHEEEKIELITSYHNSDSDSNDEPESPVKVVKCTIKPKLINKTPKIPIKKAKTKSEIIEYGPPLPPNQNYISPIGPDIPPKLVKDKPKVPDQKAEVVVPKDEDLKVKRTKIENEESHNENTLLKRLKNKAKLLEKLGGEIPTDLQKIIEEETRSLAGSSVKVPEDDKKLDIDDLLDEIEKKELPKVMKSKKIGMFDDFNKPRTTNDDSAKKSPRSTGTPPPEVKPLFPSSIYIEEPVNSLFPSADNKEENETEKEAKTELPVIEKKNVYLMDVDEALEKPSRKKLRISNSVLPERKRTETPAYTTKYSQFIEGFSSERTGLGFSKEDDKVESPKNTISYGKGLTFTKGETLNDEKSEEDLDDLTELVEAKLKYLNQLQPLPLTPVQEMLVQMQTLSEALSAGAVRAGYVRGWAARAARALRAHEAAAAPSGWTCVFLRSEGRWRYRYRREADGLVQWEFPAADNMDMDICTTPPHPGIDTKEPPPPPSQPPPPPPPPPPTRVATPSPPAWVDPPPPGCDDPSPTPPPPSETKQVIGDELASFYNDIAELEKQSAGPHSAPDSPDPPTPDYKPKDKDKDKERDKEKEKETKITKKKSKVKISTSIGMKHKSVSNLVAKWKQVADEINSD